jgi:hypothetical protein
VFLLGLNDTWMVQQIMVHARVRITLKLKAREIAIVLMAYAAGVFPGHRNHNPSGNRW